MFAIRDKDLCWPHCLSVMIFADECPNFISYHNIYFPNLRAHLQFSIMSLIDSYCESAWWCFQWGECPSTVLLWHLVASLGGAGSHHSLQRTTSDSLSSLARSPASGQRGLGSRSPQHKNSVTKAWLQFQADIEAALFRKPSNNGMYKNLSDMLHSRMDQLEQVQTPGVD